ncbi:MAG: MCE family protein [Planctomycetes bacterium]|nr:MCE family protein [Planctomycetota bacterium]
MDDRKLELRIGILVLVGIAAIALMLAVLERRLFSPKYPLKATFTNASGILEGTPVHMGGVEVGRVEEIETPTRGERLISITLSIDREVTVKSDAACSIEPRGLIGEKVLELGFGTPTAADLPKDGTAILTGVLPPSFTDLQRSIQNAVGVLEEALKKLNAIFGDEEVAANVKTTVKNAAEISEKAKVFMEDARVVASKAQQVLDDARGLADRTRTSLDNIDRQVTEVSGRFQKATQGLDQAIQEQRAELLDMEKDLRRSIAKVSDILDRADTIVEGVERGEGTVGMLLRSQEFYEKTRDLVDNLSMAAQSVTKTSDFLRKHPSSLFWGGGEEEEESPRPQKRPLPPVKGDPNRGRR